MLILFFMIWWFWFVGEGYGRELILVVRILRVLCIFEDWIESIHAFGTEETDFGDETLKP